MMRSAIVVLVVLSAPLLFPQEEADRQKTVDLQSIPLYLPRPSFWSHALSSGPVKLGNADLDEAYVRYLNGDMLSARAHLYKARFALRGAQTQDLRLRITSLACLLDIGEISDTFLLLKAGFAAPRSGIPDDGLLSARWKQAGGDDADPKLNAWIQLFTAYQEYLRGNLPDALSTWQTLAKSDASPSDARGLATLGMLEIAGEVLLDAKKNGSTPQITKEQATQIALASKMIFDEPRWLAVGQCLMLEAQIDYITGDEKAAFDTLTAANKWFEKDRPGWVDLNLIGAIGEAQAGNTKPAEEALGAVEDAIDDHRVSAEQVQQLAAFAKKLPAITGIEDDDRTIDLKLADARDFQRWADATGDPLLRLIALRTLAQLLREGGYWADAGYYTALQEDLASRYRSAIPLVKRLQTAAFLDYDFLRQTQFLEQHDPFPTDLTKLVEGYIAGQKGTMTAALQYVPNKTPAEAEAAMEANFAPLRKIAGQGDEAREKFRASMKSGDMDGARDSLVECANAFLSLERILNIWGPTHMLTTPETINEDVLSGGKRYKIHAEIGAEFWVTDTKNTQLELDQDKAYLNLLIYIMLGAMGGKEQLVTTGVRHTIAFYDENRTSLTPPDDLDIPSTLTGRGSPSNFSFPAKTEERKKLIDTATTLLRNRYHDKLTLDSVTSAGFDTTGLTNDLAKDSDADRTALEFFEKNFTKVEADSHEGTPEVSKTQDGDVPVINIKQSYKFVYKPSDDSVYEKAPAAAPGVDMQRRAEAAHRVWAEVPSPAAPPRLDQILNTLYREGFAEGVIGEFAGTTPGQLANQYSSFNTILSAGQLALSAQQKQDFRMLPNEQDFETAQKFIQQDATVRQFLSATVQIDPNAGDYLEQIREIAEKLPTIVNAFETQNEGDSDIRVNSPVRSLGDLAKMGLSPSNRLLVLLLLGESASAERASREVESNAKAQTPEQSTSLALYQIATGNYNAAERGLSAQLQEAKTRSSMSAYQLEYLLALCYRRSGDRSSETKELLASVNDLDRFRARLTTRNEAAQIQPLRQMLYEELLGELFAQQQFGAMADAMRKYRQSSKLPIAVLQQARDRDPQLYSNLHDATFAFDVLSRDQVWTTEDLSTIVPAEVVPKGPSGQQNPRQAILSGLNHMTDALIDQLRSWSEVSTPADGAMEDVPEGAIEVSYFVGASGLYRVSRTPSKGADARFVPISEPELSNLSTNFRSAIQEHRDASEPSTKLYAALLGELNGLQDAQKLYICPDGVLNFVPFQALRSAADAPYLLQQHSVTYLAGIQAEASQALASRRVLLVGNPDDTLPAAEDEVKAIAADKEFDAEPPLLSTAATVEHVREGLVGAGFVHFATHAQAYESYPNFSYLQFAGGNRLYSVDLGEISFSGKRVFLSACETRIGSILPGDDVYGIADAFLADGATSVVATLWRIESNSSALFAQRYYQLLAENGDPADAVALTAREFIEGKQKMERNGVETTLDAPLYWAGFSALAPENHRVMMAK